VVLREIVERVNEVDRAAEGAPELTQRLARSVGRGLFGHPRERRHAFERDPERPPGRLACVLHVGVAGALHASLHLLEATDLLHRYAELAEHGVRARDPARQERTGGLRGAFSVFAAVGQELVDEQHLHGRAQVAF
jgi:hypothetical protein